MIKKERKILWWKKKDPLYLYRAHFRIFLNVGQWTVRGVGIQCPCLGWFLHTSVCCRWSWTPHYNMWHQEWLRGAVQSPRDNIPANQESHSTRPRVVTSHLVVRVVGGVLHHVTEQDVPSFHTSHSLGEAENKYKISMWNFHS